MSRRKSINVYMHVGILLGICLVSILIVWYVRRVQTPRVPGALVPADFSARITNTYFSLPVGLHLVYETKTDEGVERVEIEVTGETKKIMGIDTLVYHDREWQNGELAEDTRDYMAQHKNGDVWYFGEDVSTYHDGKFLNHGGSWMAGVNGAVPGIWVKEHPVVGESYRQEYYPGEAEDMGTVLSLNETVTVPFGTFTNCLKTHDWTPLDPASLENKYYCPEIHTVVLGEDQASGEREELIDLNIQK